jgi:hypothetical protein
MSLKNLPTKQNYDELSHAYDFFNRRLFGGELPGCLFTLQRKSRSMGYFSFERFVNRDDTKSDEIALNPEYFATRPVEDVLSTMAHEQVHQWQRRFGTPPRRGYHDQEFAEKMKAIGLMPSATGTPGGKTTGEKMSHYIMADGPFIHACKELLQTSFVILWYDRFPVQMVREYEFAAATTAISTRACVVVFIFEKLLDFVICRRQEVDHVKNDVQDCDKIPQADQPLDDEPGNMGFLRPPFNKNGEDVSAQADSDEPERSHGDMRHDKNQYLPQRFIVFLMCHVRLLRW